MKYAFIDVQNTDTTTKKMHGFEIDWIKLYQFLKNSWKCENVFFYTGIDEGDVETGQITESLKRIGCVVRVKTVFAYKNKNKDIKITCPVCGHLFMEQVDMGYNKKSNCDVDLTVDAMENAKTGNEFYSRTKREK